MAIVKCPNCGKQISDRVSLCPHCGTEVERRKDSSEVHKTDLEESIKENLISALVASIEALVFTRIIGLVLALLCGFFLGKGGSRAFTEGARAFQGKMFVILLVSFIALSVVPYVLDRVSKLKRAVSIAAAAFILAAVFGASYLPGQSVIFMLQNAVNFHNVNIVGPDIVHIAIHVPFFFAASLPLCLGIFLLGRKGSELKKGLVKQALYAALSLVLTVVLSVILVMLFKLGTMGASLAGVLAVLITLVLALQKARNSERN